MVDKIAVIVNQENKIASFENGNNVLVFNKREKFWSVNEVIPYELDTSLLTSEIRELIRNIISRLDDCQIITGRSVSGLTYTLFNKMGFEIFEADDITDSLFDEIISDIVPSKETENSVNSTLFPVSVHFDGIYSIDLIALQQGNPNISSKKALQPFIETTPFYKLEVICSHIPLWFDTYFRQRKLIYTKQELESNKYIVTIINNLCKS